MPMVNLLATMKPVGSFLSNFFGRMRIMHFATKAKIGKFVSTPAN